MSGADYDVFLSYARDDDRDGAVTRLVEDVRIAFNQRTKRQLRLFFDQQDIFAAQLWRDRIKGALHASALLIAVVTEAYLGSQWCRHEWDHFTAKERAQPEESDHRRILTVYLAGEPSPPAPSPATQRWVRAIKSRQCSANFADAPKEGEAYRQRVSALTDELITALQAYHVDDDSQASTEGDSDIEHTQLLTGYVKDGRRFVRLLARAVNVTIVGMTNENLATMLQEALDRKRRRMANPEAFWGSLRIVFLSDRLLNSLNDGRSEYPDPRYELTQRELAAGYGRRSIEGFLKRSGSAKWQLFESSYYTPITGALLEMPDGSRVVQLIVPRPQRRTLDHLYLEFEDQTDQYFAATFEDIVHSSFEANRVVPIGVPRGDDNFLCTSSRWFQNVLVDKSRQSGWMPAVLLITWWNRSGQAEPLLQLRTKANSTRELDRVSHLAGYVYLDPFPGTEFELPAEVPRLAARNRMRMETGSDPPGEVEFVGTRQYLHFDKEHLFFYIYSFELPGHFQFPMRAQMYHLTVEKLWRIRKNQTLRNAIELCELVRTSSALSPAAFEIAALNLTLHDLPGVGESLLRCVQRPGTDLSDLVGELAQLETDSREHQRSGLLEVELRGLSGLQYREFFSMLLPLYSRLAIPGASEYLAAIDVDKRRRSAFARLSALYNDEDTMSEISLEL